METGTDNVATTPEMKQDTKVMTAIGLMSGTSMDGIDVAVIETNGTVVGRRGTFASYPYAESVRRRLGEVIGRAPEGSADVQNLVQDITDAHAEAVEDFCGRAGVDLADVDIVGFHGQTVFHDPKNAITCQLGDGRRLAQRLQTDVVSDFRSADVAAGGEGAPFAPLYHAALAKPLEPPVCILNLGGVGNLTWISPDGAVIAFDTGPANALVDDWVRAKTGASMDEGGEIARAGTVDVRALDRMLENPYFLAPYPKSLDRDHFDPSPVADLALEDGAATLVAFTAMSVAKAQNLLPALPNRWLVTGGGRHNPVLMSALRLSLGRPVEPVEAVGWNGDAMEAQAFAFLAVRSLMGLPLSLPTTTGVPEPMTGGVLSQA